MKTASANLTAHIQKRVTTLASLWKVTRTDGEVFAFTDHDRNIVYDGQTYKASSGFARSQIASKTDLSVDNLELTGFLDDEQITAQDLRRGKFDFATVELSLIDYTAVSDGVIKMRKGILGEAKLTDTGSYQIELRGLTQIFARRILRLYTPDCPVDLFSPPCGLNATLFREEAKVDTVLNRRRFTVPENIELVTAFGAGDVLPQNTSNVSVGGDGVFTVGSEPAEEGTLARPFLITTPSELDDVRDNTSASYALGANIDMGAFGNWTPIPTFSGTLDGRGYYIENLTLDGDTPNTDIALITSVQDLSVIRRLGMVNPTVTGDAVVGNRTACFVSEVAGSGSVTIEDCWVAGGTFDTGGSNAGVFIGIGQPDCVIRRCWAAIPITGGLGSNAGVMYGSLGGGTVDSCYFDSDVCGSTDPGDNIAGVGAAVPLTTAELHVVGGYEGFSFPEWRVPVQAAATLTFADVNPDTITRGSGSWVDDGFRVGQYVAISGTSSNDTATGTVYRIDGLTATVMTLESGATLAAETVASTVSSYARITDPGRA